MIRKKNPLREYQINGLSNREVLWRDIMALVEDRKNILKELRELNDKHNSSGRYREWSDEDLSRGRALSDQYTEKLHFWRDKVRWAHDNKSGKEYSKLMESFLCHLYNIDLLELYIDTTKEDY